MAESSAAAQAQADARPAVRYMLALLGFSAAIVVTRALIKTPMALPGHSALIWLPVLVLAGAHRRPGVAAGSAALGGLAGIAIGRIDPLELGALMVSASAVEAFALGKRGTWRSLRVVLAGLSGHVGKLVVKVIAATATGLPLNAALLPVVPTAALYLGFGVTAGLIALAALTAYERLRPPSPDA